MLCVKFFRPKGQAIFVTEAYYTAERYAPQEVQNVIYVALRIYVIKKYRMFLGTVFVNKPRLSLFTLFL